MEAKMSEPTKLHIKRRRTEDTPNTLVVESASQSASQIRYVKRHKSGVDKDGNQEPKFARPKQARDLKRREFHLQVDLPSATGKRKGRGDGVATFVEHQQKKSKQEPVEKLEESMQVEEVTSTHSSQVISTFKRPGRGSALRTTKAPAVEPETEAHRKQFEELAEYMHQATIEEMKHEARPKPVSAPRMSAARSREIHQQRIASNDSASGSKEIDLDSEDEFVYETYFLASASDASAMQVDEDGEHGNIGYLVISEAQQAQWETYLEDEPNDKDWNSDDEDENAEDYYGADYPEDEVSSDDEHGRNPYDYRGHGSDDEVWDEGTGAYSDDAYDEMMNPFQHKTTTAVRPGTS
jgi:hypothetical protein